MSSQLPGDRASVTILVQVPPPDAFRIFTDEIDQWWRSGRKFRNGERGRGVMHLEPHVGGRLFERVEGAQALVQTGTVLAWEPPQRLLLEWRAVNFAPHERTEVEVTFTGSASGTLVTLVHRGFAALRPDHPVRHGQDARSFCRGMGAWWADLLSSLREHAVR